MRKVDKIEKKCPGCDSLFYVHPCEKDRRKFCSKPCLDSSKRGTINEALQAGRALVVGEKHPMFGKKHSAESRRKMSLSRPDVNGEKSPTWKGDKVGYAGVHDWIYKVKGCPQKCEKCGTESEKKYEWANRSRTYKRDVRDWIRLCIKCHRKADYHKLPL